jgi:hypothetical protein
LGLAFEVKPLPLVHPMAFGVWFVNKRKTLSYIMCTFGIKGKKWIKNLVANAINVITTHMQILHVIYSILTNTREILSFSTTQIH